MNKTFSRILLLLAVVVVSGDAYANLTGARATPRQVRVNASADSVVSITWRVSTTTDHRAGVSSPNAIVIDPRTGEPLQDVATRFDAVGAGPFTFRETLVLDAATVRTWIEQGIRQVVLTRSFGDPVGNAVNGTAILRLDASRLQAARDAAPAGLEVLSLRLEFDAGSNTAVRSLDEELQAVLSVRYTGNGILRGRWQIAGPDSPDAALAFRTLAVVNTNLQTSQRSTLRSPALPTDRSGRYVLRFCVSEATSTSVPADALCPNADLVVLATYHVQGRDQQSTALIRNLLPDRQDVDADTIFSWASLEGAHSYRLQVYALGAEGQLVTGMLLNAETRETALTDLVRSKLQPGERYLWRVTAYDGSGSAIGRSREASFVFSPSTQP